MTSRRFSTAAALAALPLLLMLAACNPQPGDGVVNAANSGNETPVGDEAIVKPMPPYAASNRTAAPAAPYSPDRTLRLEGLGNLEVGEPVPADSGWSEHGAQASETCRVVTSPAYPSSYAIVEQGRVRRISVGERSDVKLIEGIGIGATEQAVRDAFPGFRATPHKYVEAPAKYLTAPNAAKGDVALRFEIGSDGTVTAMHVGTMPVLGYVEACS